MKNKAYPLYTLPHIDDLKDMVRTRAAETPEAIAFTYPMGRNDVENKTCAEFNNEIDALGAFLFSKGLADKHIAIIGENSYEWVLAYFTIVNGGMVAVPIDKELTSEEVSALLQRSDCTAVIYSEDYVDSVSKASGIEMLPMRDFNDFICQGISLINECKTEYSDYEVDIEKMCSIVFTSGTTGNSKGVMLSQKNIIADINNGCRNFVLEGDIIALLPFHHMFGLVVGMLMVFNYRHAVFINKSLKNVKRDLQLAKPQTTFLVPLFVETFYKQVWETAKKNGKTKKLARGMKISNILLMFGIDMRRRLFSEVLGAFGGNLEYILCGGAAIDPKYIKAFRSWGVEILNAYGVTECSPGVAVNRNYHHKDDAAGLPIQYCQVKIAEDGEVLVKGDNVMLGYYKDKKATDEAIKDGWYYTGDLGRLDDDGFLYLTGRKKNLIVLSNGENISPEELENKLIQDDAVLEVMVYEEKNTIAAEIYPDEAHIDDKVYFEQLISRINAGQPTYKQINIIHIRPNEFVKNTTRKILRYKILEERKNA